MKYLAFALISLFTLTPAFADEDIAARKAEKIKEIDEHIAKLNEHKNCINSASTADALKDCHGKMKEWRQTEHKEQMEKRRGRINERIQKLEAEKAKLK